MRLVQTNLREIDAGLDPDEYVRQVQALGANVVLFNVGGIVANYPTDLPYHHRNPHLEGDLVRSVLYRAHAAKIRFIARFDFSKIHESIAEKHPEWLYVSEAGRTVSYNGQVHACINGAYQQECLFRILEEALHRYPFDGLFFNMIGYVTHDYSGNHHGICQCRACKERFRAWSGEELPKTDDGSPTFRKYEAFRRETTDDLFLRVKDFLRSKGPTLAVCTYTPAGVDIVRRESNDPLGTWLYSASDNVKSVLGTWRNKAVSNASVHFPAYPWRHASVSPSLTRLRVAQDMIHGGWLDHYVIGHLGNQEDRASLERVAEVFRFHARHDRWFRRTSSAAEVLLVRGDREEYRGWFRILAESRVAFDVMEPAGLDEREIERPRRLSDYAVLILPEPRRWSDAAAGKLDAYVEKGGRLILSGSRTARLAGGSGEKPALESTGFVTTGETIARAPGTYLRVKAEDKTALGSGALKDLDLVYLDGDLVPCAPRGDAAPHLAYIPPAMFGPPEKCYYRKVSDIPALIVNRAGRGSAATFPWGIGAHYDRWSHHGHAALARGVVHDALGFRPRLDVGGSPLIEVSHRREVGERGGFEWVGLVNVSGQNGTVFHDPIPMTQIPFALQTDRKPRAVRALGAERPLEFVYTEDRWVRCLVPRLASHEIVLIEY